ncbi:MAG: PHP domain-containing protein [Chloroflexota bacterium]
MSVAPSDAAGVWAPAARRSGPSPAIGPSPATGSWWADDGHVHSTFSDGASTPAEDVAAAVAAGLGRLTLVDHVRAGTTWLPEFVRAVDLVRGERAIGGRLAIACGVEAKVLDRAGRLDLPDRLDGIDVVLIADHRFPGPDGPLDPAVVARWLQRGTVDVRSVLELLLGALVEAVGRSPLPAVVAHPLSILPKLGLREERVPMEWLHALATRCRATGTALEVNEKWGCPGIDVVRLFHAEGVRLVAGSDAHHASAVGRWGSARTTLSAVLGVVDEGTVAPQPG